VGAQSRSALSRTVPDDVVDALNSQSVPPFLVEPVDQACVSAPHRSTYTQLELGPTNEEDWTTII